MKLNLPWHHPAILLATWFGLGFIKKAPGTWGSLGAIPFGVLILAYGGIKPLLLLIIAITMLGLWAAREFDTAAGTHDSKAIVIDEVAGMWIALLPTGLNPLLVLLSFLLFRFFDIVKPWPVSFFDKKVSGPIGVMGDDIIAGLYTVLCLQGLLYVGFG